MKKEDEMGYSKVLYKCMNCENTFEDLRPAGDFLPYGMRILFCKNCNYQALVDLNYDEYGERISKDLKKDDKYKSYLSKSPYNNPYVIEFERCFDETVDPCPKCGGKISLSADRKCPKCSSDKLVDIKEVGLVTVKAPWVTHNRMKTKQPDNKC